MWAWEKKSINFSSIESMEYRCLSSYAKASSIQHDIPFVPKLEIAIYIL